jgi:5-keto 4-deoxyuronate isomerase
MILSLYTLHAPRRHIDYSSIKLSNDMKDDKYNYLDMDKKQFIFNSYKTQQKYRSVVVPIEDELMKVISLYLSIHSENQSLKIKSMMYIF